MKRRHLLRHLARHGCTLLREGDNHTVRQPDGEESIHDPRHRDINEDRARKICKDLQVPRPDA